MNAAAFGGWWWKRTHEDRRGKFSLRSRGLDFSPIGSNIREMMQSEAAHSVLDTGNNRLLYLRRLISAAGAMASQAFTECLNACQDADECADHPDDGNSDGQQVAGPCRRWRGRGSSRCGLCGYCPEVHGVEVVITNYEHTNRSARSVLAISSL